MKKFFFYVLLLAGLNCYAQPSPIYSYCGENTFDLTSTNDYYVEGQNINDFTFSYYVLDSDAIANVNPITNPTTYVTAAEFSIVFLKTLNNINNQEGLYPLELINIPNLGVFIDGLFILSPTNAVASVYGGQAPYTYEWSLNGVVIPNATDSSYNITGQTGQLHLSVVDANGCAGQDSRFASATLMTLQQDSINFTTNSSNIQTSTITVLSNDYFQGYPVSTFPASYTLVPISIPNGFLLNSNGTVSVLPGMPAGTYTFNYQYCLNSQPTCGIGEITITIVDQGINLIAFLDSNLNGTQEIGELNFKLGQFQYELNNNGIINNVLTSNGNYIIGDSNTSNTYNLSYAINSVYASQYILPTSNYNNVAVTSGISVYYFPIIIIPYVDLEINVSPFFSNPSPGFYYDNWITIKNNGNQTISSSTLTFNCDPSLSIGSILTSPPLVFPPNTTSVNYQVIDFLPYEERLIRISLQVPTIPSVSLGQVINNTASITIPSGDIDITNNASALSQTIIGSYDPNDKTESHGGKIVHSTFTSNDYLTYMIRFENTGTASATSIRVNDILDEKLDETSIKMVRASHPYVLDRVGNNVTWRFDGVNLPPSISGDEITGHGYIVFQIKPASGFAIGDIIPNTADIFFDFNPAIVTNTCTTEFVPLLGVNAFASDTFEYYPNPTSDIVTFNLKNTSTTIETIEVMDASGKILISKTVRYGTAEIDLSSLSQGLYLIKLKANGQTKTVKIIKN